MKHSCEKCNKQPATVHLTEIIDGKKIEKHLCEDCASTEGITIKADVPISQLLEDFVLQSSSGPEPEPTQIKCDVCGITFDEFRQKALLGCANDYQAFERVMLPVIQRAQEGATQHVGKVPHRAESSQKKQMALLRLRAELKSAVTAENYERAAALRDQIKEVDT